MANEMSSWAHDGSTAAMGAVNTGSQRRLGAATKGSGASSTTAELRTRTRHPLATPCTSTALAPASLRQNAVTVGPLDTPVRVAVEQFLLERQSRALSEGTMRFYRQKMKTIATYWSQYAIETVRDITPSKLRVLILELGRKHSPGGVHAVYRALKAFLRWWEAEYAPDGWSNPIDRVRPPKVPELPLEPVPVSDVQAMLRTCCRQSFTGDRDRAVMLCLLDTGCRAGEFRSMNVGDLDMRTGQILVRHGKGGKPRAVFLGKKSLRAVVRYLGRGQAHGSGSPLWVTVSGTRLSYSGLRDIVRRRAMRAGIAPPTLHSFRRAFALNCLRNGMDVFSLQRLMGHAGLDVLRRYLAQTTDDLRAAHSRGSPVDSNL